MSGQRPAVYVSARISVEATTIMMGGLGVRELVLDVAGVRVQLAEIEARALITAIEEVFEATPTVAHKDVLR